jgi:hypothetical protein
MQKEQFFEDQPILQSDLQLAESSKENAIRERQLDLLDPGVVVGSQLLGEPISLAVTQGPSAGLFITVNTGVAVSPEAERIIIPSVVAYNASLPTTQTDNGIGGMVLTPQSSGSQNIPVANNTINWIWVGYLETTDTSVFTLSEANNSRLFVKHDDGYIIQVTQISTNPDPTTYVLVAQVTTAGGLVTLINTTNFLQPMVYGPVLIPGSYLLSLPVLPNLSPEFNFPSSVPIIGEDNTDTLLVPSVAPYAVTLSRIPLDTTWNIPIVTGVINPTYSYVVGTPVGTQFSLNYSTGVVTFSSAASADTVTITYAEAIDPFTYTLTAPTATGQFTVDFSTGIVQFYSADANIIIGTTKVSMTYQVLNVCRQNSVTVGSTVAAYLYLNQKTTTYALGQEVTMTAHVNAYGSGVVTPNNPHGVGAADIGLAGVSELAEIAIDNGIVTPTGNASSLTSSLSPSATYQALPPGANVVTISPLAAGELVNVGGTIVSSTNIPSLLTFNFLNPNTLAPLPASTYYFYIDPTLLTVQQSTSLPPGAFAIASIYWNGATVVLPIVDLREFGVVGKNNMRLEVLLGLATGCATDNRVTDLYSAKLVGSTIVSFPSYLYMGLGGTTLVAVVNGISYSLTFPASPADVPLSEVVALIENSLLWSPSVPPITAMATAGGQIKLLAAVSLALSGSAATVLGFSGSPTAGTSTSGANPATTAAPSGLTFSVDVDNGGNQTINVPSTAVTGAEVAAAIQADLTGATVVYNSGVGYGILAQAAITGSTGGGSTVIGDLDITPATNTSITNFPPSTFSGAEHFGVDPVATNALSVAQAAFTAGMAAGNAGTLITGGILDGYTMTPGAYFTSSTATLSGTSPLTFNGAGTYTIAVDSALTTGSSGTPVMTLTGGATAANIFWYVGSAATINSGHSGTFQGSVNAYAAVTVTSGGVINGSLAATGPAGAVTLSNTTTVNGGTAGTADYVITSNTTGVNSEVVVTGAGASTLKLGVLNGGVETEGSGGSTDSGNIKELLITGSTSSTGVAGQVIPAEIDLVYNGSNILTQVVASMGNDILTTKLIYNSDGSLNSVQETVGF